MPFTSDQMRHFRFLIVMAVVHAPVTMAQVRLNEVYCDSPSTDTVEYIELHVPPGQSLSGLTVLTIEGDSESDIGSIRRAWPLADPVPDDGFFVLGTAATPNIDMNVGTSNILQNGAATVMLVNGYAPPAGGDVDADDDGVIDAGVSIGTIVDSLARFDRSTSPNVAYFGAPIVGSATSGSGGLNIARRSDGVDTDLPADWCLTSRSDAPNDPPITPPSTGADGLETGTPGVANNHSCALPPPVAIDVELSLTDTDGPVVITLPANDDESPGPERLSYRVVFGLYPLVPTTSPNVPHEIGTLTDPNNEADLTSGGVLSDHGNRVIFTPATDVAGRFSFVFSVYDGENESNVADVELFMQDAGTVVITEIMYDPANSYDSDWEWVEIHNLTPSPILLDTLFDQRCDEAIAGNLMFTSIPGHATRIIARDTNMSREVITFLAEWSLDITEVLLLWPGAEPYFRNDGDAVRLFDSNGRLLDQVEYKNGQNGWPATNGRSSIFLAGDRIDADATRTNDLPESWHISRPRADGAQATPENSSCLPIDSDVGSPTFLPDGEPEGHEAATATDTDFDLYVGDEPQNVMPVISFPPSSLTQDFIVVAGPESCGLTTGDSGTLIDDATGLPVVTGEPVLGNLLFEPPPGTGGIYTFAYVLVTQVESNIGVVRIDVQHRDRVVITEIMYNPVRCSIVNNQLREWEWIEVANRDSETVTLDTLRDENENTTGNLSATSIHPGETKVIARIDTAPSMDDFLAEWAPAALSAEKVIAVPASGWPALNQTRDVLRLFDANGELLDKASYSAYQPLPADEEGRSVFLPFGYLSSTANDAPVRWRASMDGHENGVTSISGEDIGSPGLLPFGENLAPETIDARVGVLMDTPQNVLLQSTDDGLPLGNPVSTIVMSVPQYGTLTDPVTQQSILASDLPYALADDGRVVTYAPMPGYTSSPPPMLGEDRFHFMADDGELTSESPYGEITLVVQAGGLLITEIMYDPANDDDADWEWVEVSNVSDSDIVLGTFTDDDDEPDDRIALNQAIPAGATRVITSGSNSSRSADDFLDEWTSLSSDNVIFAGAEPADSDWEKLGVSDCIRLLDDQGRLLDEVRYDHTSPWPANDGRASIYANGLPLNSCSNDEGAFWQLSRPGEEHAYMTAGGDVGSPGLRSSGSSQGPRVIRAASRRKHGISGTFDLEIPLAGPPPIEPRENGNRPVFVIEFDIPIEAADGSPECSDEVTVVNGTCLGITVNAAGLIVDMTYDRNHCVEVTLAGLRGTSGNSQPIQEPPPLRVLTNPGNADLTGEVNVIDLQAIKNVLFQEVDETNFLNDCNASGEQLNVIDLQCAKNNLFHTAKCP